MTCSVRFRATLPHRVLLTRRICTGVNHDAIQRRDEVAGLAEGGVFAAETRRCQAAGFGNPVGPATDRRLVEGAVRIAAPFFVAWPRAVQPAPPAGAPPSVGGAPPSVAGAPPCSEGEPPSAEASPPAPPVDEPPPALPPDPPPPPAPPPALPAAPPGGRGGSVSSELEHADAETPSTPTLKANNQAPRIAMGQTSIIRDVSSSILSPISRPEC